MVSTSRDRILAALRRCSAPAAELPALTGPWTEYADPVEQFMHMVRTVAGECWLARDPTDALGKLQDYPPCNQQGRQLWFCLKSPAADPSSVVDQDPHQFHDLQLVVAPGILAVAENGAVWIEERQVGQRSVLFLARHLILIVPRRHVVSHMHAAYERLAFWGPGYGCFISGPSKTADIEQSLVIGAHGPQSLLVILLDVDTSSR